MGDGAKLAIAILVIWLSLVFFFFAFHPGGAQYKGKNISNPRYMLAFLADEFSNLAGGKTATTASLTAAVSDAANYPGYTAGSSDTGSASPSGVQLA